MKNFFVCILTLFCLSSLFAESPQFQLDWAIRNSFWYYETAYQLNHVSLASDLGFGFRFTRFTLGAEALCDYVSVDGQDPERLLQGAWMNIGGRINASLLLAAWMEITLGAGGLWQQSAFQYNNSGWLSLGLPAVSAFLDINFPLWPVLNLKIKNRFDFLLSSGPSNVFSGFLPHYLGSLRLSLNPGRAISWLNLFTEATARYWNYTSNLTTLDTWMFQFQVGLSLDFLFPGKGEAEQYKDLKKLNPLDAEEQVVPTVAPEAVSLATEEEEVAPELAAFSKLKPGGKISFTNIRFEENEDILTPESMLILDRIAEIMQSNRSLIISVFAYTEYQGNIIIEIDSLERRAQVITTYLNDRGVASERLYAKVTGQVRKKEDPAEPEVVFKMAAN